MHSRTARTATAHPHPLSPHARPRPRHLDPLSTVFPQRPPLPGARSQRGCPRTGSERSRTSSRRPRCVLRGAQDGGGPVDIPPLLQVNPNPLDLSDADFLRCISFAIQESVVDINIVRRRPSLGRAYFRQGSRLTSTLFPSLLCPILPRSVPPTRPCAYLTVFSRLDLSVRHLAHPLHCSTSRARPPNPSSRLLSSLPTNLFMRSLVFPSWLRPWNHHHASLPHSRRTRLHPPAPSIARLDAFLLAHRQPLANFSLRTSTLLSGRHLFPPPPSSRTNRSFTRFVPPPRLLFLSTRSLNARRSLALDEQHIHLTARRLRTLFAQPSRAAETGQIPRRPRTGGLRRNCRD